MYLFFFFFFQFTRYWLYKIMHFSFEWVSGPGILYILYIRMVVCYCHQFILFVKYIWTWIEDILRDRPIFLLYHGFYSKSSFSYIEVLSNFSYPVTSSLIFRFNYNLVRSILFTESSKKICSQIVEWKAQWDGSICNFAWLTFLVNVYFIALSLEDSLKYNYSKYPRILLWKFYFVHHGNFHLHLLL